jgi:MarR family transcriptional regulator, lower aerobic nicotinate degradation pathway regulator
VTADQFVLLSALADADAVTQQELVRRVASDPNTVRAMLLLLEGRGLIAREPHPSDGRARCVRLTVKGRQVFKKLWTESEPLRARLLATFRPNEVTALVGLLRRVAEVMAAPASNASRTTKTKRGPGC